MYITQTLKRWEYCFASSVHWPFSVATLKGGCNIAHYISHTASCQKFNPEKWAQHLGY